MIHSINSLAGCEVRATDGAIGSTKDAYFDDESWVVRYLVVDTGHWLPGRKVLLSPFSISAVHPDRHRIDVALTRDGVRGSPDIDTDKPVSRQHEASLLAYYGYPVYWGGPLMWGGGTYPVVSPPAVSRENAIAHELRERELRESASADAHLRSSREVTGYHVQAVDGTIGHVDDFLFDEQTWAIRYAVVDTRDFWRGKHTVVPVPWIDHVEWSERTVYITAKRDVIRESPEYDPAVPLSQSYEADIERRFTQRGVRL